MSRTWTAALATAAVVAFTLGFQPRASWAGEGERVSLVDLADGETRTFGEGEALVTAQRVGDQITIRIGTGDEVKTINCGVKSDECYVYTHDSNGRVKVVVNQRSEGREEHKVMVIATGVEDLDDEDAMVWVSDDGEVHVETSGGDGEVRVEALAGGSGAHFIHLDAPDQQVLRCPQGDTTMRVEKDEADREYNCPRHGVRLEKSKPSMMRRRMVIEKQDERK